MKIIVSIALLFFLCSPAYAYIDPGTGSFLFQGLVASFFGALFTIKMYWQRLKALIFKKKGDSTLKQTEVETHCE